MTRLFNLKLSVLIAGYLMQENVFMVKLYQTRPVSLNDIQDVPLNIHSDMDDAYQDWSGKSRNHVYGEATAFFFEKSSAESKGLDLFIPLNSRTRMIVILVILSSLIICTIIGNALVFAAVLLERSLQRVSNYLIVSLAVADLMVASLVMPISALNEVSKVWWLGVPLCDFWIVMDIFCCTASILHLVGIAVDRYRAVTSVEYVRHGNRRPILITIFLVWFVAAIISIPGRFSISRGPQLREKVTVNGICEINLEPGFTIVSTGGAFFLPMTFLIGIYAKIYVAARKRIRKTKFRPKNQMYSSKRIPKDYSFDSSFISETDTTAPSTFNRLHSRKTTRASVYKIQDDSVVPFSKLPAALNCSFSNNSLEFDYNKEPNNKQVVYQTGKLSGTNDSTKCRLPDSENEHNFSKDLPPLHCRLKSLSLMEKLKLQKFENIKSPIICTELEEDETAGSAPSPIPTDLIHIQSPFLMQNSAPSPSIQMPLECKTNSITSPNCKEYATPLSTGSICQQHSICFEDNCQSSNCTEHSYLFKLHPEGNTKRIKSHAQFTFELNSEASKITNPIDQNGIVKLGRLSLYKEYHGKISKSLDQTSHSTEYKYSATRSSASPWSLAILSVCKRIRSRKLNDFKSKHSIQRRERLEQNRERKAARTLAVITGCFILCWLPFSIHALVAPFCEQTCATPASATSFFLWLGYFNSFLNPIIYTIFSPDFRTGFSKILSCRYRSCDTCICR